jgi:hypothetical protein
MRSTINEKWKEIGDGTYTQSAIDYCYSVAQPLEKLYSQIGERNFSIWNEMIEQYISKCVKIYCVEVDLATDDKAQFAARTLPQIDHMTRSRILPRKARAI